MISPSMYDQTATRMNPNPEGLDTPEMIMDRVKSAEDEDYKKVSYGLRLLVSNYLDIDGKKTTAPTKQGGRFQDVVNTSWEEGRHNSITTNTHIQVKSLVFAEPDILWANCAGKDPALVSKTRAAYYLHQWRRQNWESLYRRKLQDILTGGSGYTHIGVRDGQPFMEWADSLDVGEDMAFAEEHKKRFRWVDKHLPLMEALARYPSLAGKVKQPGKGGSGGEEIVTIRCYYSKTTAAVLYKGQLLEPPKPTPYPRLPIRKTSLIHNLSAKFPQGLVETQVGTHRLDLRLQRHFRDTVLRGIPVGMAIGPWNEHDLDRVEDGEEGVIIRSPNMDSTFAYSQSAEVSDSALKLAEMVRQWQNAESGTNDFQRNQTDTKVDFASQLAYMAQQSGIQGQFTAQVHEEGLKEDARAFMELAAQFERGPLKLTIEGHEFTFDEFMPINPLLGDDGEITVKPLGYKSPAQKLQEAMVLGEVLNIGNTLPPGMQEHFWDLCLSQFGIENKDEWMQAMAEARQAQMMMQAQQAMLAPQGQPTNPPAKQGQQSPQAGPPQQPATAPFPRP